MTIGIGGSAVEDGPGTEDVEHAVNRKPLQSKQQVNTDGCVEMAIVDGASLSQITEQANGAQPEESRQNCPL